MTCVDVLRLCIVVKVPDGAAYFFEDVHRISRRGYVPSQQDILRCRERTIGIQKEVLHLDLDGMNAEFDIYDVGGQRGERNKWVQVFRDVHAVLFLVAISEVSHQITCLYRYLRVVVESVLI
jgi:hypothetical protein